VPDYLIVAVHPPDLCPSANKAIRDMADQAGEGMPQLAESLGVTLNATYVPMTNHEIYVAVSADDANAVREFAFQSQLGQWNTIQIHQVSTLEEAIEKVHDLPTIY
jgi:uncharacterized protein with GYD domain